MSVVTTFTHHRDKNLQHCAMYVVDGQEVTQQCCDMPSITTSTHLGNKKQQNYVFCLIDAWTRSKRAMLLYVLSGRDKILLYIEQQESIVEPLYAPRIVMDNILLCARQQEPTTQPLYASIQRLHGNILLCVGQQKPTMQPLYAPRMTETTSYYMPGSRNQRHSHCMLPGGGRDNILLCVGQQEQTTQTLYALRCGMTNQQCSHCLLPGWQGQYHVIYRVA